MKEKLIEGHRCNGGACPGIIRRYPAIICSLCRDGSDVCLSAEDIERHNLLHRVKSEIRIENMRKSWRA